MPIRKHQGDAEPCQEHDDVTHQGRDHARQQVRGAAAQHEQHQPFPGQHAKSGDFLRVPAPEAAQAVDGPDATQDDAGSGQEQSAADDQPGAAQHEAGLAGL